MLNRHASFMLFAIVILAIGLISSPRPASALSTGKIISSAASTDCLDYQVVGICVWLTCTPVGCDTDTSVKVKHYMPDLEVSVYQRTGENPWSIISPLASPNSMSEFGGNRREGRAGRDHTNLRFKNADAIGDPAAEGFDLLSSFGYSCESAVTPMRPYFLSTLDFLAWRAGIPESAYPEALIPGERVIGQTGDQWGHVYPRSGFVTQVNDYKAAAVIAQRVADFVTREDQPHVYMPIQAQERQGYWPPGPIKEGDPETGKWQRLQPEQTDVCSAFPDQDYLANYTGLIPEDGDYAWVLWRPYECCERRGEVLIFAS